MTTKQGNEIVGILYAIAIGVWFPISKGVTICLTVLLALSMAELVLDIILQKLRGK